MLAALRPAFRRADALFMTAAVSDWRPRRKRTGKWRKESQSKERAIVELVANPDILATLARAKGGRLVVGFALETGAGRARALRKLRQKNADYIVLNDQSALGSERTSVTVLGRDGSSLQMLRRPKRAVAEVLVALGAPDGPRD
jgi:phosphopantothenoylcysteine decarboxylase/phosphopantothenate--cysteine ligase